MGLAWSIAGIVAGAVVFQLFGGDKVLIGAVLGYLVVEIVRLKRRVATFERGPAISAEAPAPAPRVATPDESIAPIETPPTPMPAETPRWEPVPAHSTPNAAATDANEGRIEQAIKKFLFSGNTVVRVGVIVLFFGVAFLLKYAAEHNKLPPELRLIGAALGAVALLVLGWRLRHARPGYALTLQGGAVGLLYLVIFAALRLYQMLPVTLTLALLVAIGVFAAALALLQNSLALAVLGTVGGFLAPLLASTGSGNHVALFSYYALLNAGILGIAWFKAWRPLTLVGFAFTFVISILWGQKYYRPELFASVEPFLVLHFVMYVAIAVLFALRQAPDLKGYVDGTIVFGVPLVGFALQAALVRSFEYGLAWSAFALAIFYIALAWVLFLRAATTLRLLTETFLSLGVVFATAAIPLALDARWSSAAWALEGAGIVWISLRQARPLARAFGVLLQFGAGAMFLQDLALPAGALPVLNGVYLGGLVISLAALVVAYLLHAHRAVLKSWEAPLGAFLLAWGLLWWYGIGLHEIVIQIGGSYEIATTIAFVALSCALAELLGDRLRWPMPRYPVVALVPVLFLIALASAMFQSHPFAHGGWLAWPLALGVQYWVLYRHDSASMPLLRPARHAAALWLVALLIAVELHWAVTHFIQGGGDWTLSVWGVAGAGTIALILAARTGDWPWRNHHPTYLTLGAGPIAVLLGVWVVLGNVASRGEAAPLPYVPLLSPLDLAVVFALLVVWQWSRTPAIRARTSNDIVYAVLGAVTFFWLNAMLFRTLHHYAEIPYTLAAMTPSVLAQAAISIFWSTLALSAMTLAGRLRHRTLWAVGATLLAVVVVKLFLVDLSNTGTIARIVSFVGVGVLLLVVGYLSPVPPRTQIKEAIS